MTRLYLSSPCRHCGHRRYAIYVEVPGGQRVGAIVCEHCDAPPHREPEPQEA